MKIMNKKTGEVIDFSEKKVEPIPQEKKTEEKIAERGTIQDSVKNDLGSESTIKKAKGILDVVGAPLAAAESAIANPALEMQKGNFNIGDLIKQSALGASLQKQGQYGDVMKNAGYNPVLADTIGLVLNMSPLKVYSEVSKTFGAISKMSDKGLEKAGGNLINAVTQAKNAVGAKVTQEFAKKADNISVDGLKFIDDTSKLPAPVMKRAELVFGDLADFANGLTVGKLREFKRFIGKLKPNSFGKAEHGIQESMDVKDLTQTYSNLKKTMETTLKDKASGLDSKTVDHLMNLENSYSEVIDASRHIRKSIVDSTLNKPTKVGEFAENLTRDRNSTSRVALTTIKQSSQKAMSEVNSAMKKIESFNRWETGKQVASHVFNAMTYGGMAGAVGGKILKSAQEKTQD